jgi:hypothetical protein
MMPAHHRRRAPLMLPKLIIVILLLAIVAVLFSGMVFLVKDPSRSRRTLRSLSWRVALQLLLIVFLVVAYFLGWIRPHDLGK